MKRKLLFLLAVFLLTACAVSEEPVDFGRSELFEMKAGDQSYYFKYPSGSVISLVDERYSQWRIDYAECRVFIAGDLYPYHNPDQGVKFEQKRSDGRTYEAAYLDDLMVSYGVVFDDLNYVFWLIDMENGVYGCADFVDKLAESFTDSLDYVNDEFSFGVKLLSDFTVEYLSEGVWLKKWVKLEPEGHYRVELGVFASENLGGAGDIAEYVATEYPGFSIEFVDYDGVSGFFVDEGFGGDAVRHFFTMSENKEIIYEAYLKVPSKYYGLHKGGFDEFVKGVEVF